MSIEKYPFTLNLNIALLSEIVHGIKDSFLRVKTGTLCFFG